MTSAEEMIIKDGYDDLKKLISSIPFQPNINEGTVITLFKPVKEHSDLVHFSCFLVYI